MIEERITAINDGQKALKFARLYLKEAPLSFIYHLFRKKDFKVNGHWVKKEHILKEGDIIRIYVTDAQLASFHQAREVLQNDLPYPIIYEDQNLLIVDKPRGLLTTADAYEKRKTLAHQVLDYLSYKKEFDPLHHSFVPSPAHRLDRNTAGIVVFGKTDAALKALEEMFKERTGIKKTYLALVKGHPTKTEGYIDRALKKDANKGFVRLASEKEGGKSAQTKYKLVEKYGPCSLLECKLLTGRTHQIRVHLSSIGLPILGDAKYGDFAFNHEIGSLFHWEGQFLHANSLCFLEPLEPLTYLKGKKFLSSLTKDEEELLAFLKTR